MFDGGGVAGRAMTNWFLEGYIEEDGVLREFPLKEFPVLVGRSSESVLAGASGNLSRYHAELVERDGQLVVRDLGSKNGTYVNREPVATEARLRPGDVIHFADVEFRVGAGQPSDPDDTGELTATGIITRERLPERFPRGAAELGELIEAGAVDAVYQPIVALDSGERVGQECLGRGDWPTLPGSPNELLRLAESIGRAVELSRLMRSTAVRKAGEAGLAGPTFINIHPAEMAAADALLGQMRALRADWPGLDMVLELHERAVTDFGAIERLHAQLVELGVALAYDDFGAGQARLVELSSAPPDYLKFDISLVRDIDRGAEQHRRMVAMLVGYARDAGITTLAEGVSRPGEAEACRRLGFDWAQGYHFGAPARLAC